MMRFDSLPWLSLLGGFAVGGVMSWGAARLLGAMGWMDHPEGRKLHARPMPRTGGAAFLLALALLGAMGWVRLPLDRFEWAGIGLMGLVGLLDDRLGLSAGVKSFVSLGVALVLAWDLASHVGQQGDHVFLLGLALPSRMEVTWPLLTLWLWSIPHAFNLMDGQDGLALGFFGVALAAAGLGFAPATLGFWGIYAAVLLLNFPRPMHFLGDAGSLGLGTLLAVLIMKGTVVRDAGLSLWICAYLVVDVTQVVLARWRSGRPLGLGDRGHLHHRLTDTLGAPAAVTTPLLLLLAGLPALRVLTEAWAVLASGVGLALLAMFGGVSFRAGARPREDAEGSIPAPEPRRAPRAVA